MRVVVITARGLPVSLLGLYGNLWIDTPSLDALAAAGIVFDRHFAGRADAAGVRREWRTGRYHLPAPDAADAVPEGPDLIAALRARGIHTCLVLDTSRPGLPGFDVEPEFASGWDEVVRIEAGGGDGSPLEQALEAAADALDRLTAREDWLLWLDLAAVLPPWRVPDEFLEPYFTGEEEAEEEEEEEPLSPVEEVEAGPIDPEDDWLFLCLQSTFAAAVSCLDAGIGRLLEDLQERKGGEEVVVLFTADCGLPVGEHGVVGLVRPWPHEEVVHVPLLLRLPGCAGRRVDALTQAVDLAPTLAELFGVCLPEAHGHSLLPLARGQAESVRPYACAGGRVGADIEWCLRTPDWAFLLPAKAGESERGPQLYVKPDDRCEVNNVIQHHLDLAEALERTLRAFVAAGGRPGPLVPPPLPEDEEGGKASSSGPGGGPAAT